MNKIESVKLDNGLMIYFYPDKRKHSTFFQFVTKFGGMTKDFVVDGKSYHLQDGIAHILEHYIVEENKYGNFLKILGEKQMNTNAYTYPNMTRYYFQAVEDLEYGIRMLINGIYSPIFDEEKLDRIKKPIYQEIKGRMDNKFYHSSQKSLDDIFKSIRYRSNGGSIEEVEKTTLEEVKLCYEAFYQPNNQFIVIGGNFDKKHILNIIKDIYSKLNIKSHDVKLIEVKEDDSIKNSYGEVYFPTGEEYSEITYKINISKFSVKEKLKLDFYMHYFYNMFFGITSLLYKELVDDKIITTGISCDDMLIGDFLIVSIGSYSNKSDILIKKIKNAINKLDGFDEELFELDKKDSILRIILREERLIDVILPFVENVVTFDYPYSDTKEDIESFNYDDFIKVIKQLDFSNYTVTTIKNI